MALTEGETAIIKELSDIKKLLRGMYSERESPEVIEALKIGKIETP